MSLNLHLKFSYLEDSAIGTSHVTICILTEMIMMKKIIRKKLKQYANFFTDHAFTFVTYR